MANVMSPAIGQPVIIENMPGAGGATAAMNLARAAPDGHTMLWVSSQNAIAPSMFKNLPYDWSRDFAPIGPMATFDFVLFVPSNSPLKTVKDVIDAAKKEPDKFNFGSIATGTAQNLSTLQFVSMAGLKVPVVAHPDHRRRHDRAAHRHDPGGVRDHSGRHRPDQGRADAGDRGVVDHPQSVPAGRADHRRKRPAELPRPIRGTAWWRRPKPRRP